MANKKSVCPVCDNSVSIPSNTEVSEIMNCSDCNSRLMVERIQNDQIVLQQAPAIEEDWGE